jgi:hypothetical protein
MRKFQKPLAVLLFALFVVISCKRETLPDKPDSPNEEGKTSTSSKQITYRKSAAEIAAAKEKWLQSARAAMRNDIAARGGCGEKFKNHIELIGYSGTCSGTSWNIQYYIWSLDYVGSGYATTPVSVSFTDYYNNSVSSSMISMDSILDDPNCNNWWFDGYCLLLREYEYQLTGVQTPSGAWPADIGNYTLNLLSGFVPTCTPLAITGELKGGYTGDEYAAMPARVNVNPTGGTSVLVATDCAIACPPPYVVCPGSGTFSYKPLGSPGAYTNVSLSAIGALVSGLSSGTYEYTCTLNYTIAGLPYTSLPKTGTFVIP